MTEKILLALFGAIPGLLTPLFVWLQHRSNDARELKHAEKILKRLEVIERVLKIMRENGGSASDNAIQAALLEEVLRLSQDRSIKPSTHVARPEPIRSRIRRVFLLFLPRSLKGWFLHVPFYMFLGILLVLLALVGSSMFYGEYQWEKLPNLIGGLFGILVILTFFQWAAIRLDAENSDKLSQPNPKSA